MNWTISKFACLTDDHSSSIAWRLAILAIAVVLITGVCYGSVKGVSAVFAADSSPSLPSLADDPNDVGGTTRCDECGVVESVRRLPSTATAPANYEITIRLSNGTIRVEHDTHSATWHPHERILLIDGSTIAGR
jgi:hypothetical protein